MRNTILVIFFLFSFFFLAILVADGNLQGGLMFYSPSFMKINFPLLFSILDLFKQYSAFLQERKKTSLYLIRINLEENYIVIIPEFRNECRTKWGLYLAKMV